MDFVIIANAWDAGIANPTSKHRIARELARRGHRVLWVEGSGMRQPSLGSGSDRSRMAKKLLRACRGARRAAPEDQRPELQSNRGQSGVKESPAGSGGLWVLSPLLIPVPSRRWIRTLNGAICAGVSRFWARRLGFHDPVLINYVPVLAEAMRYWKGRSWFLVPRSSLGISRGEQRSANDGPRTRNEARGTTNEERRTSNVCIYHCVDRWDAFAMYDSNMMAEMDAACCRYADAVIASARELYDRCLRYNERVHLVSHGVDHAHFSQALNRLPRPADLPAGRIVGFFGLLSEWLDQDLLRRAAASLPECQFVLIGTADVPVPKLENVPNIHRLGPRPFKDLPQYIACFNVGIIPFVVNDLTRAVNPIKLREMMAAGCPVVSTALPEVAQYADTIESGVDGSALRAVSVARDADDFIQLIEARTRRPATEEERRRISRLIASETWEAKVDEILRIVRESAGAQEAI